MKIRIKFSKEGEMKFIGHLDMVRYFQKAFRRCGIDIAYSQGFSPHQLISFAAPLGLGLTSCGEYMDIVVNSSKSSAAMINMINAEMADGIKVLSYRQIEDETRNSNAMSIVTAADYDVCFRPAKMPADFDLEAALADFLSQPQILVTKKTKKSEKEVDIRPLIYDMHTNGDHIFMKLATGSVENLKPEFVMETMLAKSKITLEPFDLLICRTQMYAGAHGTLTALEDLGYDII